jgi:superfamily II DNA or RNA helicase
VWLWDEWPEYPGRDIGIDLVAEMTDGTLCAVQAKCFDENRDIPKSELDSFISAASQRTFQHRLLVATTDGLSANAKRMLADQHVVRVMRSDLESSLDVWPASIEELSAPAQPHASPRPHQNLAIIDVTNGFKDNSRGQLIMACGTGKTLTALWIKETLKPKTTLVLVPSLNLLAQTLSEWAKNSLSPWQYLCVCSDDTVNKLDDQPISTVGDLPFEVTTNPADIAKFLSLGGERIIFSTYQSSAQVAKAQEQSGVSFDLVICDEAHRLTGKTDADYATVLDEKKIVGQKRLFMTATPRTYTTAAKTKAEERGVEITSMDDEHVYGPVLHKLSFGEAIKQELLSDYRVLIVGVTDPQVQDLIDRRELVSVNDSVNTDARTLAAHIGLAKATKDYNLKRTISFHSRIKSADQFAKDHLKILDWLPETHKPSGDTWTGTISGAMNTGDRRRLIKQLSLDSEDRHALLTNARCLTEGVDVPSLDGVAFIDPRSSQVDIIQAVGRAIRKSENKEIGTIVLPVLIPSNSNLIEALNDSGFKPIWAVLNALKSHDEDLAQKFSDFRMELGRGNKPNQLPIQIIQDLPMNIEQVLPNFRDSFTTLIIRTASSSWDESFGLLSSYVDEHGTSQIEQGTLQQNFNIGRWVSAQRNRRRNGTLSAERAALLEALPNWSWSEWTYSYDALVRYLKQTGSMSPTHEEKFEGLPIGYWVAGQRSRYRRNDLPDTHIKTLESHQQWEWNPRDKERNDRLKETIDDVLNYKQPLSERAKYFIKQAQRSAKNQETDPSRQSALTELLKLVQDRQEYFELNAVPVTKEPKKPKEPKVKPERRTKKSDLQPSPLQKSTEAILRREAKFHSNFQDFLTYCSTHGNAAFERHDSQTPKSIKQFAEKSRLQYLNGELSEDKIQLFASIPGWRWKPIDQRWMDQLERLRRWSREAKNASPIHRTMFEGYDIGSWVIKQRARYRRGELEAWRISALEELENWSWSSKTPTDLWRESFLMLEELAQKHGTTDLLRINTAIPKRLSGFIGHTRKDFREGKLEPERQALFEALPGWTWYPKFEAWKRGYEAYLEWLRQNPNSLPRSTGSKIEGFDIGDWAKRQKEAFTKNQLSDEQIRMLEQVSNWSWEY